MPRVEATPKKKRPEGTMSPRLIAGLVLAGFATVGAMYAFHRAEQFVIRDPRFALNGPDNPEDTQSLSFTGGEHTSPRAIEAVFNDDFGRSVYLVPLADRRATLRAVDWVKDASIARLWPNRLVLNITERTPVAYMSAGKEHASLIDAEGVILPPSKESFALPVLAGVRSTDPIADRRVRVQRLTKVMRDLGDAATKIAQVDVADRDNIKLSQPMDGRTVTLLLGDRNFGLRYQNFLRYFNEVQRKLPGAVTLDLRVEDRITVVE
jgi:cell division protein FtsQ